MITQSREDTKDKTESKGDIQSDTQHDSSRNTKIQSIKRQTKHYRVREIHQKELEDRQTHKTSKESD